MKIKGLFFGMFACAALAACSNEDIVEEGKVIEEVKANLTLVIGATSDSSRAAGDNEDGESEDKGTSVESTVQDALVLLSQTKEAGGVEQAFYLSGDDLNQQGTGADATFEPQLTVTKAGSYRVIVILNPCAEIEAAGKAFIANSTTIPSGKESMYDYITSYEVKATTGDNPTSAIATDDNFMMVNIDAETADVQSNQSGAPSTVTDIEVERVVSKITYKVAQPNNIYSVDDVTTLYTVETAKGWRIDGGIATEMTGMAHGTLNGEDIYLHNTTYYVKSGEYNGGMLCQVKTDVDPEAIVWATSSTESTRKWYVQLDKVALVNLSNSVYAVRHRATETTWSDPSFFGKLSSTDYLMDPNTLAKNNSETNYSNYFYNTASEVKDVQVTIAGEETDEFNKYFIGLPTSTDEHENATVGKRLAYCFENIVKKDNQNGNYVTGVIFRGRICDANGNTYNGNVYKYDGKYYLSLAEAAANHKKSINEIEAEAITYEKGHCYYASKDIYHNKANDATMKHAIMRNNVYVLSVKGFNGIGSAEIVFPTSGENVDPNFYLKLSAKIVPWQVRLNEITF